MPSKEYYRKLKKEAHDLYVRDGMMCKEISERINVSERSVSNWINENDALWKKERQASVISSKKQGDNLKQIINILADQKLELLRMIDEAIAEGAGVTETGGRTGQQCGAMGKPAQRSG